MRALITGAAGFVGGYLAEELIRFHPEARLFGAVHGPSIHPHTPVALEPLQGDLTDPSAIRAIVDAARPTHVFHLAGFASAAGTDAARIRGVNVDATVELLRALSERGEPCAVLLASSGYVYGATAPGRPAREDDPLAPEGPYASSKAEMEVAAREVAAPSLSVTVARAFNHTGPYQSPAFAVPAFARQIARIERGGEAPVVRVGNLEARRDFLDVRDVVRAYRMLLCGASSEPWRVVNVCSGVATAMREALDLLVSASTVAVAVEIDPARLRPSDMPECVGDPSRLKDLTGWAPERRFEETLAETLAWWRTQDLG